MGALVDPRFRDLTWLDKPHFFPFDDATKRKIQLLLDSAVERIQAGRSLYGFWEDMDLEDDNNDVNRQDGKGGIVIPPFKRAKTDAYTADMAQNLFGIAAAPQLIPQDWRAQLQRWRTANLNVAPTKDVLHWWCEHASAYPLISQVARQVLAIQITAAASERVWSFLTKIDRPERSALSPESVETLLFLKCNLVGVLSEVDLIDSDDN